MNSPVKQKSQWQRKSFAVVSWMAAWHDFHSRIGRLQNPQSACAFTACGRDRLRVMYTMRASTQSRSIVIAQEVKNPQEIDKGITQNIKQTKRHNICISMSPLAISYCVCKRSRKPHLMLAFSWGNLNVRMIASQRRVACGDAKSCLTQKHSISDQRSHAISWCIACLFLVKKYTEFVAIYRSGQVMWRGEQAREKEAEKRKAKGEKSFRGVWPSDEKTSLWRLFNADILIVLFIKQSKMVLNICQSLVIKQFTLPKSNELSTFRHFDRCRWLIQPHGGVSSGIHFFSETRTHACDASVERRKWQILMNSAWLHPPCSLCGRSSNVESHVKGETPKCPRCDKCHSISQCARFHVVFSKFYRDAQSGWHHGRERRARSAHSRIEHERGVSTPPRRTVSIFKFWRFDLHRLKITN